MKNIVIEKRHNGHLEGTYHGQPYKISLEKGIDLNSMLTNDEVLEVVKEFNKSKNNSSFMLNVECGSKVMVAVEEGHCYYEYFLVVDSIDEEGVDDEGNYFCVAYGTGVSDEDKEMAEEFTSRIEPLNFVEVIR